MTSRCKQMGVEHLRKLKKLLIGLFRKFSLPLFRKF